MFYCGLDVAMKSSYVYITDSQGLKKAAGEVATEKAALTQRLRRQRRHAEYPRAALGALLGANWRARVDSDRLRWTWRLTRARGASRGWNKKSSRNRGKNRRRERCRSG